MRILVTGAAGFIGSHLAERLATLGHDVTGVDSFSDYYSVALKELNGREVEAAGARLVRADLAGDRLDDSLAGVEIVYHLAAQPGISATSTFDSYVRNNLTATHALLEAARRQADLRCFVNISTSSVYGVHATDPEDAPPKPMSYYGVTKLAAEQLAMAYHRDKGLPACSLRLFSVYGPRERPDKLYRKLIRCILEDSEIPVFEGSEAHTRSYSYISDILDGLVAVLDHLDDCNGEIFNIGSDVEITTGEGIRIVEEIMGRKAKKVRKPKRAGDQLRTHANIAKARERLGYAPRVSAREGLQAEVEWYRDKIYGKVSE